MNDLDIALFNAWAKVAPKLLADPAELHRRLARRQSKLYRRPLRAWCVAARASDHRIDDTHALIYPRTALDPRHTGLLAEHTVTLDKPLLERICASVRICAPGEPADHIARKLGCTTLTLMNLRRTGFLSTNLKPGLMGRHGPPVPLVYSPDYLDPQARGREPADPIFAGSWQLNPELLPDDLAQTITRIPHYVSMGGRAVFRGWYWICPSCKMSTQSVYYPVDQPDLPSMLGFPPAIAAPLPKPTPTFACRECHGILGFSRVEVGRSWNILILRITGGLMFGREVQKPDWLTSQRKRAYRPITPRPAPRRDLVQRLLVETTLTRPQIAAQTGMPLRRVRKHAAAIYKHHHVHTRQDLQRLLRPSQSLPVAAAG